MENIQLTPAYRKSLADLLGPYREMRGSAERKYHADRRALRDSILREVMEEKGGVRTLAQIEKLRNEVEKAEAELANLGFVVDDSGDLDLSHGAPKSLRGLVDKRIDKELGSESHIHKTFDLAIVKIWTAKNISDVEQIMSSLI